MKIPEEWDIDLVNNPSGISWGSDQLTKDDLINLKEQVEKIDKKISANAKLPRRIKSTKSQLLEWEDFQLDTMSGQALISGKSHIFNTNKPAFFIFKALLEKRKENLGDGIVSYLELMQVTGLKDKEDIKQVVRNLRKNLRMSYKTNTDVFQPAGGGYRLVKPLSKSTF